MDPSELLTIGEVARRADIAASALRFYDAEGLVRAVRDPGGRRRYPREALRRLAFIRAAQNVGLSLEDVREALASLPNTRTPTKGDWERVSRAWRHRLDEQIDALTSLRDGLTACIGCGCLSLRACALMNPADEAAAFGSGAMRLPAALRRPAARQG